MGITYKVSGPHVVYQNIDGEVIIVDLQNGFYFSVTRCGTSVWEGLVNSLSKEVIIEEMIGRYDATRENIESAIENFVDQLKSEQLVVEDVSANANTDSSRNVDIENAAAGPGAASGGRSTDTPLPFEPPRLEKFTDMEDVLVLDPIHDVDESGWPHQVKA